MGLINNLVQFISGTKAIASEVNQNFEALRVSHNDQENRLSSLETRVGNLTTVNVKDYGAKGDGTTDDTGAIQNAINTVYTAGGGTVVIPEGIFRVSSLTRLWGSSVSVNIVGSGMASTVLKKLGGDNSPIFDFSAVNPVDILSCIKDLKIVGNINNSDGIRVNTLSKFLIDNVAVLSCDKAVNNLGSGTFTINNCLFTDNNYGLYSRKSTVGAYYGNNITILSSRFINNGILGVDFGQGSGLNIMASTFESNGTTENTSTGALVLRSNIVEETTFAIINVDKCTFKTNKGITFKQEANANANTCLRDTHFLQCENGKAIDVAPTRIIISNVIIPTTGDTVIITGGRAYIENSYINILTNNATNKTELNVQTAALQGRGFTTPLLIGNGSSIFMAWGGADDYKHELRSNTSTNSFEIRPYGGNDTVFYCSAKVDSCAWNGNKLWLGTYRLWVDANGRLRIKASSPTSDTDGTVVGTQT